MYLVYILRNTIMLSKLKLFEPESSFSNCIAFILFCVIQICLIVIKTDL